MPEELNEDTQFVADCKVYGLEHLQATCMNQPHVNKAKVTSPIIREQLFLIGIFCVAILLRFYHLGYQSYWFDEILCVNDSSNLFRNIHKVILASPPIFHYVIRVFLIVFGKDDFWLRVPSFIFGIVMVPSIYWTTTKLGSRNMGLITALILSVLPFHVVYSQECRMYSLVALIALWSIYFWEKAITADNGLDWIRYAGVSLLGLYVHNWFPFLIASQSLWWFYMCIYKRSFNKYSIGSHLAIFILYLPWLNMVHRQINKPIFDFIQRPTLRDIRETFYSYSGIKAPSGHSWIGVGTDARIPICIVFIIFLFLGLIREGVLRDRTIRIFLTGCLLPLSLALAFSLAIKPIFVSNRYTIIGLFGFLFVIARGICGNSEYFPKWSSALLIAWCACLVKPYKGYFSEYRKAPWKDAAQWIKESQLPMSSLDLSLLDDKDGLALRYYLPQSFADVPRYFGRSIIPVREKNIQSIPKREISQIKHIDDLIIYITK